MKTTLLIPVWNEIIGLKAIMPKIDRKWVDQIVFIDGGSTDGTIEWLEANQYIYHIQKNKGMRNAYKEIMPFVIGDIVVTFSPDGNSIPEIIPELIQEIKKGYDMVIVSRYKEYAVSFDDDKVTGFGNWLFTSLINIIYGGKYTDSMVIYRAYQRRLIEKLKLFDEKYYWIERLLMTNISIEPLMSIRCAKHRLNVTEIPGDEPSRIGGERKLRIFKWGASYLFQILTDWVRR